MASLPDLLGAQLGLIIEAAWSSGETCLWESEQGWRPLQAVTSGLRSQHGFLSCDRDRPFFFQTHLSSLLSITAQRSLCWWGRGINPGTSPTLGKHYSTALPPPSQAGLSTFLTFIADSCIVSHQWFIYTYSFNACLFLSISVRSTWTAVCPFFMCYWSDLAAQEAGICSLW